MKRIIFLIAILIVGACAENKTNTQNNTAKAEGKAKVGAKTETQALVGAKMDVPEAPQQTKAITAAPKLYFFMNPNGRPCQVQYSILQNMASELESYADVVYFQTNIQGDLLKFQEFGVRSIPLLVLVDANGKEVRRLNPGVYEASQIMNFVSQ